MPQIALKGFHEASLLFLLKPLTREFHGPTVLGNYARIDSEIYRLDPLFTSWTVLHHEREARFIARLATLYIHLAAY